MHRKHTTAEDGMKTARSVSHSGKTLRWYLSFRPVAVMAAAFAALLTTGLVAGPLAGVSSAATSHATLATTNLGYTSLPSPVRIADTRTVAGGGTVNPYNGKTLAEGTSQTIDIPPSAGVPINAGAIVVNVTAVNPSAAGFLSVYPGGAALSTAANVTFAAGQNVGNLVTVGLGPDAATGAAQSFTVYDGPSTGGGSVDFTADVAGYYAPQAASAGAPYVGLTSPNRIYDSRSAANGGTPGAPGAGTTLTNGGSDTVTVVGGSTGVPITATAVVLNVAVTNATAPSFITAFPAGSTQPGTASQNFVAGETLSSQVIAGVGTGGAVTIANHAGNVDIVVDVDGYFGAQGATGSLFNALPVPVRLVDTRPTGVAGGATATATIQGAGATAGALSIADVATPGDGNYLTAYPAGNSVPFVASVNYTSGDSYNVIENSAYAATGSGEVNVFNGPPTAATTNVVVDEDGYFAPPSAAAAYTVTTPSTAQVTVSTGAAPTAGDVTYTATGLPTAAGTTADIALFPGTGVNAPKGNTFTTPAVATAGAAAGQGTTNTGTAGTPVAEIVSVNGVAVTAGTTNFGAAPLNGSLTFTVNSTAPDSTIPVVFTGPTTTLQVTAAGSPSTGYAAGTGSETTWNAAPAAAGTTAGSLVVSLVNTAAGTFQACTPVAATAPQTGFVPGNTGCKTYTYTNAGDTYANPAGAPTEFLSAAQFAQILSGPVSQAVTGPASIANIDGDEIGQFSYNPTGPSNFVFAGNGDVPAAPTGLGAVAGTSGGVTVTWTAPPNPDVVGTGGGGAGEGSYDLYRAVAGTTNYLLVLPTTGTVTTAGTVTTYTDSAANDTTTPTAGVDAGPPVPGVSYTYAVEAVAAANGGGQVGPLSTAFTYAPPGSGGATTPVIASVAITASSTTGPTAGTAIVTYNTAASCGTTAGPDFSYSNTAGTGGAVAGTTCTQTSANVLTFGLATTYLVGTTPNPTVVVAPVSGDTLKYTAPGSETVANSVWGGTTAIPLYAATQTVTDTGNPTNTTSTVGPPPSNPLT
jgi:hypothetical protein